MPAVDTRNTQRESFYLLAYFRLNDGKVEHPIKVRNLSATGMMAIGGVEVEPKDRVAVDLRNIGWVGGKVAWVEEDRFGVEFDEPIDPIRAREPVSDDGHAARWMRAQKAQMASLRKI